MSLKNWFILLFGLANHKLRLRAEDANKTYAGHGNWTVFQRRMNGDVDFNRGWDYYVNGFGKKDGDFWLGLEELHQMTKGGDMSLEINMTSRSINNHWVAKYRYFRVGPAYDHYRLHVSGYSGSAPYDSLAYQNNFQFSTKDADHDGMPWLNFASLYEGGWWYGHWGFTNLNGNFSDEYGMFWLDGAGDVMLLCCSEMKIYKRP